MGWLHDLPTGWMAVVILAATYLVAAAIFLVVMALARDRRADAFKAVSPGLLPPMALLFGLLVGFLAAQVWSDSGRAQLAVDREASALRSVVLLMEAFPGEPEAQMRMLLRRQIKESVTEEWPAMARGDATLTVIPVALDRALRLGLNLTPRTEGQKTAQREIVASVQTAFDARRQRIILSESSVNWVKWTGVILVGIFTLIAIAFVQSGNRLAAALALWLFASAMACSLVLIASQDRPFSGEFRIRPDLLEQVAPRS
ncbi:MAG TPA: hypothetical protein VFT35_05150 [Gaiellaceae bacterium]|nr:hypothetical protein [Gaiellaceae bacterium]